MKRVICFALLLWSELLSAHTLAPSMLQIQPAFNSQPWEYQVQLRQDISAQDIQLHWPAGCTPHTQNIQRQQRQLDRDFRLRCDAALDNRVLRVDGLGPRASALIVKDNRLPRAQTHLITAAHNSLRLSSSPEGVWSHYLQLGGEHILAGWDHLMLILGVFWLAHSLRQMIGLATAFTLGHSVTLAAAALDYWRLPSSWVEFAIAITLLWLALKLGSAKRSHMQRRPYLLISLFGLIHGMGFASSLLAIGLPQDALIPALLAFNIGVELGQVSVLLSLGLVSLCISLFNARYLDHLRTLSLYCIGSLAFFWLIERSPSLLN